MFGRKENRFAKLTFTFVAGAVVGAAVALLYAPMTGKKMQRQVKDVIDDQMDNVEKMMKKVRTA